MIMDLCLLGVGPFVWLGGIRYTSVTVHAHIYAKFPLPHLSHTQTEREKGRFASWCRINPLQQLELVIRSIS